jgi:hypothetical protein
VEGRDRESEGEKREGAELEGENKRGGGVESIPFFKTMKFLHGAPFWFF